MKRPGLADGVIGLGFVLVYQTVIVAAAQTAPVLAPIAAFDLGVDPEKVGLFTTLVFAVAMISSTGTAGLLTRFGSFAGAAFSLFFAGAGAVMIAQALGAWGLVSAAVLIGIAYGPVNPVGSRVLARVAAGPRQNFLFSLKQSSVAIGAAAAGAALPAIALDLGWRAASLAAGGACLAAALLILPARLRLGADGDPGASKRFAWPFRPAMGLLAEPRQRGLAIAVFSFSMAQFGFMSIYVTMIWAETGLAPERAAAMLSIAMGTSVLGRLYWGWRADRGSPRKVLSLLAWSGAGLLAVLLGLGPDWPAAAVAAISLSLGLGPLAWSGVLLSEVARVGGEIGGPRGVVTATAGTMVFAYLGGLVGPGILSLSAAIAGSYAPGIALMALTFAASALFIGREPAPAKEIQ